MSSTSSQNPSQANTPSNHNRSGAINLRLKNPSNLIPSTQSSTRNHDPSFISTLGSLDPRKAGPSSCNNLSEYSEVDPSTTRKPQLTSPSASTPQPLSESTENPPPSTETTDSPLPSEPTNKLPSTQPPTMSSSSSPGNTTGTAGPAGSTSASVAGQPHYHLPYAPFPFRMPDNANVRGIGSNHGQGSGGGKGK